MPGTLQAIAQGPGLSTVALTPGDGDFAPGPLRFSFLVIAKDGRVVAKRTADVWIARGYKRKPYRHATARLETVGVPGAADTSPDSSTTYVARLNAPAPGLYWVVARPKGSAISGVGNLSVRRHSYSPEVGAKAPDSNTPTLTTTHGRLGPLTTSIKPDRHLYTTSIAQALAAHEAFVVTFATPKFCTSRLCGPAVDVVSAVRKSAPGTIGFIHVEVYEHNDPSQGYNRWMKGWGLRSEPWVFLVGRDGRIKGKFEGAVSVRELRAAVKSLLVD